MSLKSSRCYNFILVFLSIGSCQEVVGTAALGGAAAKASAAADKIGDDLDAFSADLDAYDSKPSTPTRSTTPEPSVSPSDDDGLDDLLAGL